MTHANGLPNGGRIVLREAFNVDDLKERDKIVRRLRRIRADAVLDKNTIERWNRLHPTEKPLDSSWCDEVIAWCDGGPFPACAIPAYKKIGDDPLPELGS